MDVSIREANMISALGDPSSPYFQHMCALLRASDAQERAAKAASSFTTIPFAVPDADVVALEKQFSVVLKSRGSIPRGRMTDRVAGLVFVLEASLLEHAGSSGRSVLLVDGDMMSMAAIGMEDRIIERTNCHARNAYGYFQEDDYLARSATTRKSPISARAHILRDEVRVGIGEHFSDKVRADGPRTDSVVVNHFKTPVGLAQMAWLVKCRASVGYGAFPFQMEMRTQASGRLDCFPGWFYVCKETDTLTLVPDADATMCISHPYTALMEFVDNNSVFVEGKEFLCEKYMGVPGILYYTINLVDSEYMISEKLRTHYCDHRMFGVAAVEYPKAVLSSEGVCVGFERSRVCMPQNRLDRVLSRLSMSRSKIIQPSEVYGALMDYNNTTVNTLDSAVVADRISYADEEELAYALALHVNWRRHAAGGTLSTLLNAVKLRHSTTDASALKFAYLALSAWWSRPDVSRSVAEEIPFPKVIDSCGADFSVVINEVDPWLEVTQDLYASGKSQQFDYLPKYGPAKQKRKLETRKSDESIVVGGDRTRVRRSVGLMPKVATSIATVEHVVVESAWEERAVRSDLTEVKSVLKDKLASDQAASADVIRGHDVSKMQSGVPACVPWVAVPDVDPVSSIRSDLDRICKGLPERDAVSTGYRLAEVEIDKVTSGSIAINDAKREIPKARYVRRPKVDAGVEGKRVQSAAALLGAVFKRNVGIPNNRGAVDMDLTPDMCVDRVINVCFKSNWQEIVNRHLDHGMWQANETDIDEFLGKIDERKAKRMLGEFFSEGDIRLDEWMLMAKGKVKPSREPDSDMKVDHSQTIMYLKSSSVNAFYSAQMRRAKKCTDECLRDEVKLNAQWSAEESEEWYNSIEPMRRSVGKTYSYSNDTSAYDRAQEHPALLTESSFYRRLGLNKETYDKWTEEHGVKRATAMMYGVILWIVMCGISGDWKTLFRNGFIQLAAIVVSAELKRDDIVCLEVKGDDSDGEYKRPIKVEHAVTGMTVRFNLTSKYHTNDVRCFCKKFRIKVCGRWVEVGDPWTKIQSLCTPIWIGDQTDDLAERWVSLVADLRHYDNGLVVDAVAEATQRFYGLDEVPYGMCRALSRIRSDKNAYMSFFLPPELVS